MDTLTVHQIEQAERQGYRTLVIYSKHEAEW